jgi:uncharacterized protein YkwD
VNRLHTLLFAILLSVACAVAATTAFATAAPERPRAGAGARETRASSPAVAHSSTRGHRHKGKSAACAPAARKHRRTHTVRHCGKGARNTIHGPTSPRSQAAVGASRRHDGTGHAGPTGPTGTAGKEGGHSRQPAAPVPVNGASTSATIAAVLDTPCQNTELTPTAENLQALDEATLCLVNQERARADELPLQPNAPLTHVAQQHSEAMVGEDYFSHTAPNGETQLERVIASGYIPNSQVGYTVGENIAWGTSYLATPSAIVAAWIASPEHLANILNGEYRDSGIGIDPAVAASLAEGQAGAMYTQDFGVIQD